MRWSSVSEEELRILGVHVDTFTKHRFKFLIIGLPHNYLQVGAVEVEVSDLVARIGDEELPDVWQDEPRVLLASLRNVLEIKARAERVLRRGEAVGFRPCDVE